MTHRVKLGDLAKDSITGFKGVAIARTEYLNGCERIALQPEKLSKDGLPIEDRYFDEPQVILVKPKSKPKAKPVGGPREKSVRRR